MADERLIPAGIRDESTKAFNELIDRLGTIDLTPLLVYIIDNVDASALPHLAEQFHVMGDEGWKLAESDNERRQLIKNAIELHRYKGTKYALKKVLEILNLRGEILEWFDYGGEPYKFKVRVDLLTRGIDEETFNLLKGMILEYKNARSWLERLDVYLTNKSAIPVYVPEVLSGEEITVYPYNITELEQNESIYYGVGYQAVETTTIYPL